MNYEIPDELCFSMYAKMEELNMKQDIPSPLLQGDMNYFDCLHQICINAIFFVFYFLFPHKSKIFRS
jgi:hypothetical protein